MPYSDLEFWVHPYHTKENISTIDYLLITISLHVLYLWNGSGGELLFFSNAKQMGLTEVNGTFWVWPWPFVFSRKVLIPGQTRPRSSHPPWSRHMTFINKIAFLFSWRKWYHYSNKNMSFVDPLPPTWRWGGGLCSKRTEIDENKERLLLQPGDSI